MTAERYYTAVAEGENQERAYFPLDFPCACFYEYYVHIYTFVGTEVQVMKWLVEEGPQIGAELN